MNQSNQAVERVQGQCLWFDQKKGFGFITPLSGEDNIFVHHSEIRARGFRCLDQGEHVEYAVSEDDQGRRKAIDVTGPNRSFVRGTFNPNPNAARAPPPPATNFQMPATTAPAQGWYYQPSPYGEMPPQNPTNGFLAFATVDATGSPTLVPVQMPAPQPTFCPSPGSYPLTVLSPVAYAACPPSPTAIRLSPAMGRHQVTSPPPPPPLTDNQQNVTPLPAAPSESSPNHTAASGAPSSPSSSSSSLDVSGHGLTRVKPSHPRSLSLNANSAEPNTDRPETNTDRPETNPTKVAGESPPEASAKAATIRTVLHIQPTTSTTSNPTKRDQINNTSSVSAATDGLGQLSLT